MKALLPCSLFVLLQALSCSQGDTPRDEESSSTASQTPGPATPAPPPISFPLQDETGCIPGLMETNGELHGQYDAMTMTVAGQEYYLQVNEWNSMALQTMTYGGDFFFKMTEQQASAPTTGAPTGFPSMFIGANAGHSTARSNLPKQVSALTTVPTSWQWADAGTLADTNTNSYNVTYDVWFSLGPEGDPTDFSPSAGFLMVWLYDPPDAQPIGSPTHTNITVANVPGTWDAWVGANGGVPIISYLAKTPIQSLSFDMNDFIQDAVQNRPGTVQSSWYLSNVFIGFEIWRGGVGLETTSFCAIVN